MFEDTEWSQLDLGWLYGCGLPPRARRRAAGGTDETGELGPEQPNGAAALARAAELRFTLVTFNVLGSNHTSPRSDAGEYSPARVRSEWMIDYLRTSGPASSASRRSNATRWPGSPRVRPRRTPCGQATEDGAGPPDHHRVAASAWRLVKTDLVPTPFITQTRDMPLVKLEHRETGRNIWVMNIHNAPQDYQSQRNVARAPRDRRLAKIRRAPADLPRGRLQRRAAGLLRNHRQLGFVAPRGGVRGRALPSANGSCGSTGSSAARASSSPATARTGSPLVTLITDHAVLRTRVPVP